MFKVHGIAHKGIYLEKREFCNFWGGRLMSERSKLIEEDKDMKSFWM